MNNGDISAPKGRGRGWQMNNQARELRRPKAVSDEPKGMHCSHYEYSRLSQSNNPIPATCDVAHWPARIAFFIITIPTSGES